MEEEDSIEDKCKHPVIAIASKTEYGFCLVCRVGNVIPNEDYVIRVDHLYYIHRFDEFRRRHMKKPHQVYDLIKYDRQ